MNALVLRGPIADTLDQIFEPIEFKTLADLFSEYATERTKMEQIASFFDGTNVDLIRFFVKGNSDGSHFVSPERLFALERGIKALDASYWQRALNLTDVLESMPQKRRDEWHEQITKLDTPPFNEETVISTLQHLLVQRHKFFAERVDGVFRSLSTEHVTNRPEGFSKRMILNYVYDGLGANWSRSGTINDLRCIIAKFMGREDPRSSTTTKAIEFARREHCGQWITLDGGSLRMRLYKKGTAHLEVHPEMAWRLNSVLASIYPNAIPEKHRTRRKRTPPKDFKLYNRPIPTAVLDLLSDGRREGRRFSFYWNTDKTTPAYAEACDVLASLGGIEVGSQFLFTYDFHDVLSEVCFSGVIPDQRVHQFYPTPRPIAAHVVEAAAIEDHMTVLEPSAGQGNIADLLPKDRTTLVEVAPLNCRVLKAKGYPNIVQEDFLKWHPGRRFDRIVMNPPFTKQQWRRHLEHASDLLAAEGRIVAVLPVGASKRDVLPGWSCSWSDPMPFPGTSIEVTILVAERPAS